MMRKRPKKFRGSPKSQAFLILSELNMIGQSRYKAKEHVRKMYAPQQVPSHVLNRSLGIYSYATYDQYKKVIIDFLTYTRSTYNVRDALKITDQHVQKFLEHKLRPGLKRSGIKKTTLKAYCAALEKMQMSLSTYYNVAADWTPVLDEIKTSVGIDPVKPRAFEKPIDVVSNVVEPNCRTLAEIQLYGGARVKEVNRLKPKNLLGKNRLRLTHTKGGRKRTIFVPAAVYAKIEAEVQMNGVFDVDYTTYSEQLQASCRELNVPWNGTHGLRWNYTQISYDSAIARGLPEESACLLVAEELGHSRASITRHYLHR